MIDGAIIQAGAIPLRRQADGAWRVMLVKSRSGLWIVPKGHIEHGHTALATAGREAFEEAGVEGTLLPDRAGHYRYQKLERDYRVDLYVLFVSRVLAEWPERDRRVRQWFSLDRARDVVGFEGLRAALARAATRAAAA